MSDGFRQDIGWHQRIEVVDGKPISINEWAWNNYEWIDITSHSDALKYGYDVRIYLRGRKLEPIPELPESPRWP